MGTVWDGGWIIARIPPWVFPKKQGAFPPLLGERAGVRADVKTKWIKDGIDAGRFPAQTRSTGPKGKSMKRKILQTMLAVLVCAGANAQVNSGSNGNDGAFNPTTNTVINMADHPDGIYQYTSVNIPSGVTVTFIPNANNSPVTWLVQSNVVINGTVNLSGQDIGAGGPGGWAGGSGGVTISLTSPIF
jgi:hypothetical protein